MFSISFYFDYCQSLWYIFDQAVCICDLDTRLLGVVYFDKAFGDGYRREIVRTVSQSSSEMKLNIATFIFNTKRY
jgi:hypothetical protein